MHTSHRIALPFIFSCACFVAASCSTSTTTPSLIPATTTIQVKPTPTFLATTSVASPTSPPVPTDIPWSVLHSDDLFLGLSYPKEWSHTSQGTTLLVASSEDGFQQGVSSGAALVVIQRVRYPIREGQGPEEVLRTMVAGLDLSRPIASTELGGQPSVTANFTLSSATPSSVGKITVTATNGVMTIVQLISLQSTWDQYSSELQQIQDSIKFDRVGFAEPDLPTVLRKAEGLLVDSDLPAGSIFAMPYRLSQLGFTEAYFQKWLEGFSGGRVTAPVSHFQVFYPANQGTEPVWVFLAYPLTSKEVEFVDQLLTDPESFARAVGYDPNISPSPSISNHAILDSFQNLGEASQAVMITPEENQFFPQPNKDYVVIRRGAILAVVRHDHDVYGTLMTSDDLLALAETLDARIRALVEAQPSLTRPRLGQSATDDTSQNLLGEIVHSDFDFPDNYQTLNETVPDIAQERLVSYGWRLIGYAQSGCLTGDKEAAQLYVIYPLDQTEKQVFDWLLPSPERIAEFFMQYVLTARGDNLPLFYSEFYRTYTETLPADFGDAHGAVTLVAGGASQDVVLIRRDNALLVATVLYFDSTPSVRAIDLVDQLDKLAIPILEEDNEP